MFFRVISVIMKQFHQFLSPYTHQIVASFGWKFLRESGGWPKWIADAEHKNHIKPTFSDPVRPKINPNFGTSYST
jgi:hypothetical protein